MAILNLSIQVPDAQAADILADFCAYHGYQATLEGGVPNPQTRAQFAKATIIAFIRNSVAAERVKRAEVVRLAAIAEAEAIPMT